MPVSIEKFEPIVLPHVPGCPIPTVHDAIIEGAAEFCKRSRLWRVDVEDDFTSPGDADHELDIPPLSVIEDVLWIKFKGQSPLRRVSDRVQEPSDDLAQPREYAIYQDRFIRFYDTPDLAYQFDGVVILKPSLLAQSIEDFLYETHRRCIANWALARLMEIPDKEWTNFNLSAVYDDRFLNGIDEAKSRDNRKTKQRAKAYFQ